MTRKALLLLVCYVGSNNFFGLEMRAQEATAQVQVIQQYPQVIQQYPSGHVFGQPLAAPMTEVVPTQHQSKVANVSFVNDTGKRIVVRAFVADLLKSGYSHEFAAGESHGAQLYAGPRVVGIWYEGKAFSQVLKIDGRGPNEKQKVNIRYNIRMRDGNIRLDPSSYISQQ